MLGYGTDPALYGSLKLVLANLPCHRPHYMGEKGPGGGGGGECKVEECAGRILGLEIKHISF